MGRNAWFWLAAAVLLLGSIGVLGASVNMESAPDNEETVTRPRYPLQTPSATDNTAESTSAVADSFPPGLPTPPEHSLAVDPFRYRPPQEGEQFVPSPPSTPLPPGIRVLGILMVRGGRPLAALEFPGEDKVYYVHEEDVVGMYVSSTGGQQNGAAKTRRNGKEILYLKIKKITAQQVEVYPQQSPSNIHILR